MGQYVNRAMLTMRTMAASASKKSSVTSRFDARLINGRLKQEMRRVGLTQVKLSRETGVAQSSISRFARERGLARDAIIALLIGCAEHGVDLGYVFAGRHHVAVQAETEELARLVADRVSKQIAASRQPLPHKGPRPDNDAR